MSADLPKVPASKKLIWAGWIFTILPSAMLLMGGAFSFVSSPEMEQNSLRMGWDPKLSIALGITSITCTILFLIPRTAILGAILLTGYLGGAIATHVRIGESFAFAAVFGVVIWLALFLREPRLRELIPLRR